MNFTSQEVILDNFAKAKRVKYSLKKGGEKFETNIRKVDLAKYPPSNRGSRNCFHANDCYRSTNRSRTVNQ